MIKARFRAKLPEETWIAAVSGAFPDATFRLLTSLRADPGTVELGAVEGADPDAVAEAFRAHSSVVDYRELDRTAETAVAKYRTTEVGFQEFVDALGVPPEYPIDVRNGWFQFDLTGTRAEFDQLRAGLAEADVAYELLSVVGSDDEDGLLTDRQREVLDAALRSGYFEVPRECTLAELAATLDVDKSTASAVLRRGEARVLKWFLTGASDGPSP